MDNLRARGATSTITDLDSTTTRALTGAQMARSISDMFIAKNVTEWESHIEGIDKPDYYISFAAIVSSTLTLAYPDAVVDRVATALFDLFSVEQDVRDFIAKDYLPEASNGNKPSVVCKRTIVTNFSSEALPMEIISKYLRSCNCRRIFCRLASSCSMGFFGKKMSSETHWCLIPP